MENKITDYLDALISDHFSEWSFSGRLKDTGDVYHTISAEDVKSYAVLLTSAFIDGGDQEQMYNDMYFVGLSLAIIALSNGAKDTGHLKTIPDIQEHIAVCGPIVEGLEKICKVDKR